MSKTFQTRIKHKKDTHANWTTNNPVLLDGEIAIVDNNGVVEFKIGDGSTAYNSLPFYKAPVGNSTLTGSRALISDSNGKVSVSAVTSTELGYLDGVTSAIQTQLNGKASTSAATTSANGLMTSAMVTKLNGIATNANNYSLPVATSSAIGGVKSGTDITVDSSGNVSVNDDSHNHVISNIDNLQSTLDAKVPTSRTVNGKALSSNISLTASDVGAATVNTTTRTIAATEWSSNSVTITNSLITASNIVIVAPSPESYVEWGACKVRAVTQSNGSLTFECDEVPSAAITANIVVIGG